MPQFTTRSTSCESLNMGTPDSDVIELHKDIKRSIVNRELMMLYGHDTAGYLPPLPNQERPRSSYAPAWSIENPALRQLGSRCRRGPRARLPGAHPGPSPSESNTWGITLSLPTRPSTVMSEVNTRCRPHTAYTSYVKSVLNRRVSEVVRPNSSLGIMESMSQRRGAGDDLDRLIFPSQMSLRADDARSIEDIPDFNTEDTNIANRLNKSPRLMRNNRRKKRESRKKKPVGVDAKRNAEVLKVLKGEWETLPVEPSTLVRLYICANAADMEQERRVLQQTVFPQLRDYCHHLGLDFYIVDLKGGADVSMDQEYSVSGVYVREIRACQENSVGPALLLLLGDRYGVAPLPSKIEAEEFELMKKMAEEERLPKNYLLEEWFQKDDNAVPPVYVLQTRPVENKNRRGRRRKEQSAPYSNKRVRAQIYAQLQQLLQEAISVALEEGKLMYQERKNKYFKATVEDEVHAGVLHHKNAADQSLCYIREFSDLPRNAYNEVSRKYTDMQVRDGQAKPDAVARKALQQMKSNVTNKLEETSNIRNYEPSLAEYVQSETESQTHSDTDSPLYLQQFEHDVICDVKGLIERAKETLDATANAKHYSMYQQVLPHARLAEEVTEKFFGRTHLLEAVEGYMKDVERCRRPLVIHGSAGYGKTCVMGMLAKKTRIWFDPCITVLRFLSDTLQTADIKNVLVSICSHIVTVYNLDSIPTGSGENIDKISRVFHSILEQVSKWHGEKKPLVILLDGLDQLTTKNRSRSLQWLPTSLPKYVHLIVSVKSDQKYLWQCVQKRLPYPQCFMEIGAVSEKTVGEMISFALQQAKRTLQPEQMDFLLKNCKANPHPIYLALTVKEAVTWCSYTKIDDDHVPSTAEDAVSRVLDRLETKYGLKLVQDTVSYLVMAGTGLTETELLNVLSCNDEVLQDVFIQHDLPMEDVVVMPSFLLASLLDDLNVFLCRRNKDNKTVLAWRNASYRQLCAKKYFDTYKPLTSPSEESQGYCHDLAEIFLQDAGIQKPFEHPMTYTVLENADRQVTPQVLTSDNHRKLKLLPWFITQSGRQTEAVEDLKQNCFCNFHWLLAKIKGLSVNSVIDELYITDAQDNDLNMMRHILPLAKPGLELDHNSLACHLVGMVPHIGQDYPGVCHMVDEARSWLAMVTTPLIIPMIPCFPSPHAPCVAKFCGIVEVLVADIDGQVSVVKSKDGVIQFWDLSTAEMVQSTAVQYDHVTPNIFCSARSLAIYSHTQLSLWDIDMCQALVSVDLCELTSEEISTTQHLCHTEHFVIIALQTSDDDFNQAISIIHAKENRLVAKISNFDLKDEFYQNSAGFVHNGEILVVAYGRSESEGDSGSTDRLPDVVRLRTYQVSTGELLHEANCGSKTFSSMLLRHDANVAVISWSDASFDLYDLATCDKVGEVPAPDINLVVKACSLTSSGSLLFLASTESKEATLLYSALWRWNLEEEQLEQFFIKRHRDKHEVFERLLVREPQQYAVITSPGTAKLWLFDLQGRKPIQTIAAHPSGTSGLLGTADPYTFFTGSPQEGVVKRWDVRQIVTRGVDAHPMFSSQRSSTPADGILKRQGSRHKLGSARSAKSVRFADGYGDESASSTGSSRPGTATLVDDGTPTRSVTPDGATVVRREPADRALHNVSRVVISTNSCHLAVGYDNSLPVLWDANTGHVVLKMAPCTASDFGTPWVDFASKDRYVIGLTITNKAAEGGIQYYMFQMWSKETGHAIRPQEDMFSTACCVTFDREKVLLANVENWDSTGEDAHDLVFKVFHIHEQQILRSIAYQNNIVPSTIQLTEDEKCAVTNNINPNSGTNHDIVMFTIETAEPSPQPSFYEFLAGKKYAEYCPTRNIVMKNGLALAIGLNGDMQLWDIPTCEYEGNLCEDPGVKDTRNPGIHTHGGCTVGAAAVSSNGRYLVVGSEDCTASLWDLENELMLCRYANHSGEVTAVGISEDNQLVLTGSSDKTLCVWHFNKPTSPVCSLHVYVPLSDLSISADRRTVAALGTAPNEPVTLLLFRLKNIPDLEPPQTGVV